MITQPELKQIINYNAETGELLWIKTIARKAKKGNPAGTRDRTSGYQNVRIKGRIYRSHRIAWFYMYNEWPKCLDHINHDRSDNRLINLRKVTHIENMRNISLSRKNISGVCGVYWDKEREGWIAVIKVYYKRIFLGRFTDKFEAICSRMSANNKYGFHENHGK